MDLAARVAPLTLARERCLPVHPVLGDLLPDAGLVRGRVVGCGGDAAWSLALALAAGASTAGSWLAVVGVPTIGVEAAAELGVAIERMVAVEADPRSPREWAERVAATADGMELVLTVVPPGSQRWWRMVRQRVQQRGAVVLAVPAGRVGSGEPAVDVQVTARTLAWEGVGEGYGRLCRRRVEVRVGGRRAPRPVVGECWLPGTSGALEPVVSPDLDVTAVIERSPQRDHLELLSDPAELSELSGLADLAGAG